MKIAVYHNLPSGGAKRTLYEVVSHLTSRHQFDVYSTSLADQAYADLTPHSRRNQVFPFKTGKLFNSPFGRINMLVRLGDLRKIRELNRLIAAQINRENYDVIFINPCRVEIAPSVLSYLAGSPTVYYCHEPPRILYEQMPYRPYNEKSAIGNLADRIDPFPKRYFAHLKKNDRENTQKAHLILANSEFARTTVKNVYNREPFVAYPGVDATLFHPIDLDRERVVLSVGSLTPLKNFDFIIRSLATIPGHLRPPLWLVSNFQNPPEYAFLQNLAEQTGVEVRFFGNITDQELVNFYNRAKVTVYTPIREPFGLVPLESMACATPVVAVREGGIQETIEDGKTGWLVERDLNALADKIMFALDHSHVASQMGKNGRQVVLDKWTWGQVTARFEDYFDSAWKNN